MTVFTDDFNRPDGGLGNNWVGPGNIVSGVAVLGATSVTTNQTFSAAGRHELIANVLTTTNQDVAIRLVVKRSSAGSSYYDVRGTGTLAQPTWALNLVTANNIIWTSSFGGSGLNNGANVLRLVWDTGVLTLWVNGFLIGSRGDNANAAYNTFAIAAGAYTVKFDSVTVYGDDVVGLSANPSVIGAYGQCTAVSLTGQNTSWVAGTPGFPLFTVNHGHISTQTVTDATHATVTVCPDNYIGAIAITDPTSGHSVTITASSDPAVIPPPGVSFAPKLTDHGAASINTPAERYLEIGPTEVLGSQTVIIPAGFMYGGTFPSDINIVNALANIYAAVVLQQAIPGLKGFWEVMQAINGNATLPPPPYDIYTEPLAATLKKILDRSDNMTVGQTLTLQSVIDSLGSPDLAPILNALGLADYPLYTSIAQMVRAVRGDDVSSILGILSELGAIRTTHGYDLGDLMTAIAGVTATVDLSPVLTAIAALRGGTATVQTVRDKQDDLQTTLNSISSSLAAMRTGSGLTLQSILDAIAAIPAPVAGAYEGAPVWPGQAAVTLGAPAALADQLVLNGPMHGIIVNVTVPPRGLGQYLVGGRRLDYGQMRIAFETDHGELEPWQYFGFEQALYTPSSMQRASKCRFQLLGAQEGTATPWLRS